MARSSDPCFNPESAWEPALTPPPYESWECEAGAVECSGRPPAHNRNTLNLR